MPCCELILPTISRKLPSSTNLCFDLQISILQTNLEFLRDSSIDMIY